MRTEQLVRDCRAWYDELSFHRVYHAIYDFATSDLSALYFDVLKDRLYTTAPRSRGRRSAQTALYRINYALVRLAAPLITYTAEEVWQHMKKPAGAPESVHMALFPEPEELTAGIGEGQRKRAANWERLMSVRESVLKSLETARQEKSIGAPLEAQVRLRANGDLYPLLEEYAGALPGLFIVSQVTIEKQPEETLAVEIGRAAGTKCERCWKYKDDVGSNPQWPTICGSCAEAVEEIVKA
jgi:isoleucyl-tRNA synthetase